MWFYLAEEAARLPQATACIDKGLPLCWEVTVSGGNAEEEGIVLLQIVRLVHGRDAAVLGRSIHLAQNALGEGFWDPGSPSA